MIQNLLCGQNQHHFLIKMFGHESWLKSPSSVATTWPSSYWESADLEHTSHQLVPQGLGDTAINHPQIPGSGHNRIHTP